MNGAVTLLGAPFQETFTVYKAGYRPEPHVAVEQRFGIEHLPVHSPLLGESWLVSFPPLTYMLKFSGLSGIYQVVKSERVSSYNLEPSTSLKRRFSYSFQSRPFENGLTTAEESKQTDVFLSTRLKSVYECCITRIGIEKQYSDQTPKPDG